MVREARKYQIQSIMIRQQLNNILKNNLVRIESILEQFSREAINNYLVNTKLAISWLLFAFCFSMSLPSVARTESPSHTFHKLQFPELTGVTSFHWLHQDKKGLIWIATKSALYRFDGYNLETFNHDPSDENSLLNTQNYVIFEDGDDNLWFGGGYGLSRYIPSKNAFKRYEYDAKDKFTIPKGSVLTSLVDSQGRFWISTHEGLAIYKPTEDVFERYVPFTRTLKEAGSETEVPRIHVTGLHELSPGRFLLATYSNGIYIYDHKNKSTQHHPIIFNGQEIKLIRSSFELETGQFLFATHFGVIKFDLTNLQTTSFYPESITSDIVKHGYPVIFQPDNKGGVYIADGKLHYYSGDNLNTYFRAGDLNIKNLSKSNRVSGILKTHENGMLVAVDGVGLFSAHHSLDATPLVTDLERPIKASNSTPSAIVEDRNKLVWVAEGDSVKVFEETESASRVNILAQLPLYGINSFAFTEGGKRFAADSNIIYQINPDFSYQILISAEEIGLKVITSIDWIDEDELIISAHQGLFRFRIGERQVSKLITPINLEEYHKKLFIISPDRTQMLVAFWRDGFLIYDFKQDKVTKMYRPDEPDYPIPYTKIAGLTRASNTNVWLTLEEKGHALYDWDTAKMQVFPSHGASIACIAGTRNSYYIQLNAGSLLNIEKGKLMETYGATEGVMPGVLNSDTCLLSSSNHLYLGSTSGLRAFQKPSDNTVPPNAILTELLIAEETQSDIDQILADFEGPVKSPVEIPYDKNIFTFRYSSSSIAYSHGNLYRYKLLGLDESWHYANSSQRSATYTNLDAGSYTFVVQASNNSGVFSKGKQVSVIVRANPLLSWWAMSFYAAIIASAVIGWITVLRTTVRRQTKQIADNSLSLEQKNKELLELTDKIRKLLKVKDSLLKHISHEFKTPLTVLMGYLRDVESALTNYPGVSNGEEKGAMVIRQIKYIDHLVSQLMDLSRLEGAIDLQLKPMNISQELNNIVPMFDAYARQFNVEIRTSIQANLVVDVEKESFDRIITNLVSNAIKYNRRNGSVDISATENSGKVKIAIRDTGIGILGSDKEAIFKQFGKIENREMLDHPVASTGLGLAIVKEAVEANLGTIEVKSEIGRGSEFIVNFDSSQGEMELKDIQSDFPAYQDKELLLATQDHTIAEQKVVFDELKKLILVVEDTDDIAKLLISILSPDFNVIRAANGAEGLAMAKAKVPDVIISDIMMPVMDGFEFAKAVQNDTSTCHIPLLFLTAVGSEEAQLNGLDIGAVDFIHKPFNPAVVHLKVQNIIKHNLRLAERFAQVSTMVTKDVRKKASRDPEFTEKLDAYIEKHLGEKITVEGMASSLYMDRSAFSRKVKAMTTLNAQQYILHYRLAKAYDFLSTAQSVAEVAQQLGFSTQNHLSTAFSKQFGITCRDRMSGKVSDRQPALAELVRN